MQSRPMVLEIDFRPRIIVSDDLLQEIGLEPYTPLTGSRIYQATKTNPSSHFT
jgi:hypothetical protein